MSLERLNRRRREHSLRAEGVQEREARRRQLEKLDRDVLERIQKRFGEYIPTGRLERAARVSVGFLEHEAYQRHLKGLGIQTQEGTRILGDFHQGQIDIDRNQQELPRTLAHERMHQLSDPRLRENLPRLGEGMAEYLSQQVSPDLHLQDVAKSYPEERSVVELMAARAGDAAISRAYFRGEWDVLQRRIASDLDDGALQQAVHALEAGRDREAQDLLRGEG